MYDIIIIGGGPAGLTAATYARRAGKSVLVLEKHAFGGQITWSPLVENFPAIQSISGTELGDRMLEQAMEHGADVELEEVTRVEARDDGVKHVTTESGAEYGSAQGCLSGSWSAPGLPSQSAWATASRSVWATASRSAWATVSQPGCNGLLCHSP